MTKDTLYSDSLVEIKSDSILFRRYSFFERDRLVLFSDIEKIVVKKPPSGMESSASTAPAISKPGFPKIFKDTNAIRFLWLISDTNGGGLGLLWKIQIRQSKFSRKKD